MIRCKLCKSRFKIITSTHLSFIHNITLKEYTTKFGTKNCGFFSPNVLPKDDRRYKKWRESLKKRPAPWNKGHTKDTHSSVLKTSRTFRRRKIDNFAKWRDKMKRSGRIPYDYPPFKKNADLAELIGVVLGDGHIGKFPRTEALSISSNANNPGFIKRYSDLVEKLFDKKPTLVNYSDENCIKIRIYQKNISKRLNIPIGAKKKKKMLIPKWIFANKKYLIRYLRGLYEAEGSFCVHKPTYTYKFLFSNRNGSLLKNVYRALEKLGFHPHRSRDKIQISRKKEVYRCKDLIKFRRY